MSEAIVEVRDLRKVYNGWSWGGRRRVEALRGVSLQAHAGEVFGLLGPNGAGKTTLIKILLGVVKPTAGSASLFAQPAGSSRARMRVGYLPESLRVDVHHTARTALRYYGRLSRMSSGEINRRSDELLELVGLQGRDRESVRRFSKGMYQRLGLAQALLPDPDLLVLDEPTDGLDPVGRSEVRRLIERLRDSGKTIFLNSHILQEVELVCTRVAIMAGGEIRGVGRIDELSGVGQSDRVEMVIAESDSDGGTQEHWQQRIAGCLGALAAEDLIVEMMPQPGRVRVKVALSDQQLIDRAVDSVRAAGLSICHLRVDHPTLEDTFIRLVGQSPEPLSVGSQAQPAGDGPNVAPVHGEVTEEAIS